MRVLLVKRKKRAYGNFSIESSFHVIRQYLDDLLEIEVWESPYYSVGIVPRLLSVLSLMLKTKKFRPDVTHITGDVHFLIFGVAHGKSVLTIHDTGFLYNSRGLKFRLLRFFWLTAPVNKADLVTCVSNETKSEVLRLLQYVRHIEVVPTVVDSQFIRRSKMFNSECPNVLLLGSAPNKNLKRVIKATRGLNLRLCIVAKLSQDEYELLSSHNYEVCENIPVDEILVKYYQSDIVAFCSIFEGFGMPIIEAQRTGRVVLTSNCSSMPEVAGKGALFVDPFSVESIREGLLALIIDAKLRENLVLEGFKNVRRFDVKTVALSYFKLYNSLI